MYYPPHPRIRDYTAAATLTLILYLTGWFPGLVFNLIKLLIAVCEKDSYDYVQGFGCLVWLLIVCGFGPIIALVSAYLILVHVVLH